jgi:hypothetical protein
VTDLDWIWSRQVQNIMTEWRAQPNPNKRVAAAILPVQMQQLLLLCIKPGGNIRVKLQPVTGGLVQQGFQLSDAAAVKPLLLWIFNSKQRKQSGVPSRSGQPYDEREREGGKEGCFYYFHLCRTVICAGLLAF